MESDATARVVSVNISQRKGTRKQAIDVAEAVVDLGFRQDAHAGNGHRQISLLSQQSIDKMVDLGLTVGPGDFAENITTTGIDLPSLSIGTRMQIGQDVIVEVTQIGKECHARCAIYQQAGDCVMPREGIFVRVLMGGPIGSGDEIRIADRSVESGPEEVRVGFPEREDSAPQ